MESNLTTPTQNDMKVTAIAPWFGSKRTMAPIIVAELGPHRAYFEPFCGGMSVLLNKPPCGHETINDLHSDLINLARVIQDVKLGSQLYRRLRRVVLHEEVLEEAWESLALATNPLDRAYWYFVASWTGRNGFAGTSNVVGTKGIAVRWTPGGGHGGRLAAVVDSLPAFRQRIRRVTILNRDAFDIIAKIDDTGGVAVYVDSPYVVKDGEYVHDFSSDDHRRLAEALRRFKISRVVVSYYDCDIVRQLYRGWTVRECTMNKGIYNAGKRGGTGKAAPELLIINGPSYAAMPGGMFT
jgi:DNA adenine methylase